MTNLRYLSRFNRSFNGAKINNSSLTPVAQSERIKALDLLRGLAMFGVLWSNLNDWYGYVEPSNAFDNGLFWIQNNLIESRFYTLLCLLFGIGFGIQLLRATDRGMDIKNTYFTRSLTLLVIGIIHAYFIWNADILSMYALVAFSLILFRKSSTRNILIAAILIWFLAPEFVGRALRLVGWNQPFTTSILYSKSSDWILGHGSWLQIEAVRISSIVEWMGRFALRFYGSILATFLMGLWATKSGYMMRVIEDPKTTRRLLLISVIAAAIGYLSYAYFASLWPPLKIRPTGITDPYFWYPRQLVMRIFDWSTEGTAVAYAAILILLLQKFRTSRLFNPLAATGRMALTTYLTQSVVCTLLFYGYGLGWYDKVSFTGKFVITIILFACQMVISSWWLKRFRFGPVEWLWRRLSYGRPLRMCVDEKPIV